MAAANVLLFLWRKGRVKSKLAKTSKVVLGRTKLLGHVQRRTRKLYKRRKDREIRGLNP